MSGSSILRRLPAPARALWSSRSATGGGKLLVGLPADARGRLFVGDLGVAGVAGELVLRLDEQPRLGLLAAARLHPHEMPSPLDPCAVEGEFQMALGETFVGIADRGPAAAIPHDHRAAAVLALRNVALEVEILDRMVLGAHREPLLAQREARAAGDGPALEHAVELEPQVVVKPAGGMLLHHELAGRVSRGLRLRLRRPCEVALAGIFDELLARRGLRGGGFRLAASRCRLLWSAVLRCLSLHVLGAPWRLTRIRAAGFRRTSTPGGRAPPTASSHRPRDSAATIAPPRRGAPAAAA